ncbi:MAG: AraC family transcriptional regulator [Victivallaceae bacterium]|nr:AraC family transcriptional regulator [Victivallaceae bacterium]
MPDVPGYGPVWRGTWDAGRIERNRKLYDFELVLFVSGSAVVTTEAGVFRCDTGSVIVIPPDMAHATVAATRVERWCVHFTWKADVVVNSMPTVEHWSEDDGTFDPKRIADIPHDLREFPWFHAVMPIGFLETARDFFDGHGKSGAATQTGRLMTMLGMLIDDEGSVRTRESRLAIDIKHEIEENFRNPGLSVLGIATAHGVTPGHVARVFRDISGISPMGYVLKLRLETAKEMLAKEPLLRIKEIAAKSGFDDANYFSRVFRKSTGCSPSEFRINAWEN